jgi:hypothetical protein
VNTPSTTPPALDTFETALLGELRAHVATRPATAPVRQAPRPHRPRRWATGLAAAAAAATAYVVVSPGGPAVSPAYAVSENADGEVVVTVHRLEDADGLEQALREHGIDAEVSFDPDDHLGDFVFEGPEEELPPLSGTETGRTVEREKGGSGGPTLERPGQGNGTADPSDDVGCGTGEPATLTQEGDAWVLRIPADSPLQDREVQLTTTAGGELMAAYPGDDPGSYCAVVSAD